MRIFFIILTSPVNIDFSILSSCSISLSASIPCLHPEGQWPQSYHPEYNANKCWYRCPLTVCTSDYTLVPALNWDRNIYHVYSEYLHIWSRSLLTFWCITCTTATFRFLFKLACLCNKDFLHVRARIVCCCTEWFRFYLLTCILNCWDHIPLTVGIGKIISSVNCEFC